MKFIVWFSIILAVSAYICSALVDPDLWWHIVVGRWILAHAEFPQQDYWNRFALGKPWLAYSWSSEILFAVSEKIAGVYGLLILKLCFALALSTSLCYCLSKISKDWFIGSLLGLYTVLSCSSHFSLRPQILVWIFFAWLLYALEQAKPNAWLKTAMGIMLIMSAWANTHITTILGIIAVIAHANSEQRLKFFVFALVGTLVTPYLGREWLVFFAKADHPFGFASVTEFAPATILDHSTGLLLIELVFLISLISQNPKALRIQKFVFLCLLLLMSLAVVKFLPLASIALSFALADIWCNSQTKSKLALSLLELKDFFYRIPRQGLSFLCLCFVVVKVAGLWQSPIDRDLTPVDAVNFIEEHSLPKPLMNSFSQGGYLIYRASDSDGNAKDLVALDGRTNLIDHELWHKYLAALNGRPEWRDFFELVKPETVLWRADSPLVTILLQDQEWCMIYERLTPKEGQVVFISHAVWQARREIFKSKNCT